MRTLILTVCVAIAGWTAGWAEDLQFPTDELLGRAGKGAGVPKQSTQYMPYLDAGIHDNGHFYTVINNNGIVGNLFQIEYRSEAKQAPSFYHPRYSRIQHGYWAALWIGGVVDDDTLVSVSLGTEWQRYHWPWPMEFWPDTYPFGTLEETSNIPGSPHYDRNARAEVQFQAVFTDTFEREWFTPVNTWDQRDHRPLNLEVTQTSYSWSFKYARDFIIVDYHIRNLGNKLIKDAWIGLYYAGCIHHRGEQPGPPSDDISGYILGTVPEIYECGIDSLMIAYIRDNDGWSHSFTWDFVNTTSAFCIAPLRLPTPTATNNFNWWNNQYGSWFNWGPRHKGSWDLPLRKYADGGLGQPLSDRDMYNMMSYPEVDYPGHEAAVDHSEDFWLPPNVNGGRIARGHLPEFVTSYGPVDILPYGSTDLTVVMAVGEDVHWNRMAYEEAFDTLYPDAFAAQLDFSDLIENVRWAHRIYDNPGVDTDGDGDSGRFVWLVDEESHDSSKVYCEGDGVPDFHGASPPPPPDLRVHTEQGRLIVRWNGRNTENFRDPFSLTRDFEGYRVYLSRSYREDETILLASYDAENYSRHKWDHIRRRWQLTELPFTLDSLRRIYGEDFEPLEHPPGNPLIVRGELFYFSKVDYNHSDLLDVAGIHKIYPDATKDTSDVDDQGRMRFYEYEYVIDGLLSSVPYWVSVTAFDFGHPPKNLDPLESSPSANMLEAYAMDQGERVLSNGRLNVYCYPNPYRVDADYAGRGLENRTGEMWGERARAIRFVNLPHRCSISIYTLDGDLVKKFKHDERPGSGSAGVESWDLINANVEAVVTGLYYWVVESEYGTQVGKLTILK